MTGLELSVQLSKYTKPPTHANKSEVFVLYYSVTGKNADRNCLNCAIECFMELKRLAKQYGEKIISLNDDNRNQMKEQQSTLKKYRIEKPFRVHGDPKVYANWNTTDDEVDFLISINSALRHNFILIEQPKSHSVKVEKEVKIIRTKKLKKDATNNDN